MLALCKGAGKLRRHRMWLKLFPATRLLELDAVDILGPFARQTMGTNSCWSSLTDMRSSPARCPCVPSQPTQCRKPSAIIRCSRTAPRYTSCRLTASSVRPNSSGPPARLWEFENCSRRPITRRRMARLNVTTPQFWRPCGPMWPNIWTTGKVSPLHFLTGATHKYVGQRASSRRSLRLAGLRCICSCKYWPPRGIGLFSSAGRVLGPTEGPHVGQK